jgi:hypothetical protein
VTELIMIGSETVEATAEQVAEIAKARAAWASSEPDQPPLTARQLRLGLVSNGLALDQVDTAIAAIEDPQQRAVASIEWEYASQFERVHPLIAQVGTMLGLTDEAVDVMWAEAAGV